MSFLFPSQRQSIESTIYNKISNQVKMEAKTIIDTGSYNEGSNTFILDESVVLGDVSIGQNISMKSRFAASIEAIQKVQIGQTIKSVLEQFAEVEMPNISLVNGKQSVDQFLRNNQENYAAVESEVKTGCVQQATASNYAAIRGSFIGGDLSVEQDIEMDLAANCLAKSKSFNTMMQELDLAIKQDSKATINDVISAIIAIIMLGLMGALFAAGSSSAIKFSNPSVSGIKKSSIQGYLIILQMLLPVAFLFAADCGGVFPLVKIFKLNIPPSMCRTGKKVKKTDKDGNTIKVSEYRREGVWAWSVIAVLFAFGVVLVVRSR